jgi:hypothetical protein
MLAMRDYLLRLENNLMLGSGRWTADFSESFWGFRAGAVTFDMLILGSMRPRGFLLSRFFAWVALPDHRVACFVSSEDPDVRRLGALTKSIGREMKERDLSWSWLVLPREDSFSEKAKAAVQKNDIREMGIALVELAGRKVTTSDTLVGHRMKRVVGVFK